MGERRPVLMVGRSSVSSAFAQHLQSVGIDTQVVEKETQLQQASRLQPQAILLMEATAGVRRTVELIRSDQVLAKLPLLANASRLEMDDLLSLGVDDWVHTPDELPSRLKSASATRLAVETASRSREQLEVLLEIAQAASSSLELEKILRIAVEQIGRVIRADRCSVVLVDGPDAEVAQVMATLEPSPTVPALELQLSLYPELRKALRSRQPVLVENAQNDPLMSEVRPHIGPLGRCSILVQPLISQDELLGALFLRHSQEEESFTPQARDLASAAAAAIASPIRNARLHAAIRKRRDDLEEAYTERYRELAQANLRLKELDRLKDDLIAVCSHDVRSPLQILLGHGRLLLDSVLKEDQRSAAETMVRQGRRILALVESLLERGRADLGRQTLQRDPVDLGLLCQEVVEEMSILANERRIRLALQAETGLTLSADALKLQEVLQNLLSNALQHVPQRGEVRVTAERVLRPQGEFARLRVSDSGPGIAAELLASVFERYRHGGQGNGLGLSICREFVELHGGEIWAANKEGGGAEFTVMLPLASRGEG